MEEWKNCLDESTCKGKWKAAGVSNYADHFTCRSPCVNGLRPVLLLCTHNGTVGEFCSEKRGYHQILMRACDESDNCKVSAPQHDFIETSNEKRQRKESVATQAEDRPVSVGAAANKDTTDSLVMILAAVVALLFVFALFVTLCFTKTRKELMRSKSQKKEDGGGSTEAVVDMSVWRGNLNPTRPLPATKTRHQRSRDRTNFRRHNRLMSEPAAMGRSAEGFASTQRICHVTAPYHQPIQQTPPPEEPQYFVPFDTKRCPPLPAPVPEYAVPKHAVPKYAVPNSLPVPTPMINRLHENNKKSWYDVPVIRSPQHQTAAAVSENHVTSSVTTAYTLPKNMQQESKEKEEVERRRTTTMKPRSNIVSAHTYDQIN